MLKLRGLPRSRSLASIAAGLAAIAVVSANGANAVSLHAKLACSRDYYAFCSQYSSNSPEVRQCMKAVGEKLSARCINALVEEGELSPTKVARRAAQLPQ